MKHSVMRILNLSLAVALIGCASTANYQRALNTWVGASVDELIFAWGPPSNSADLSSGGRVLSYFQSSTSVITQSFSSGLAVSTPVESSCQTLFRSDDSGVITSYKITGDCKMHKANCRSAAHPASGIDCY